MVEQKYTDESVTQELERIEIQEVSRYRTLNRFWTIPFVCLTSLSVVIAANQMFNLGFFVKVVLIENRYMYVLAGLLMPLVFIIFPPHAKARKDIVPWYDILLVLINFAVMMYFAVVAEQILDGGWEYVGPPLAIGCSIVMWALLVEAGRRTGGWPIFIITVVASLFPTYADMVPAFFQGATQTFWDAAAFHMMSAESFLGIPMRAFGSLVFGFLIFGVALQYTGAGAFFINLAFAMMGHVRGGPAKVAIFASGLFGSMSGSVVTNVLTTGTMSIPAMKRTGFRATYAGGVEACASTGGVLMPPIMGATAFVMAEFLGIAYADVAIAAAVPALLYYFGLFMQIDSYAVTHKMKGLPREELPSLRQTLKDGWYYIFAFGLLIWMLLYLQQEQTAPFYATAVLLVINQVMSKTHRLTWEKSKRFIIGLGVLLSELVGILGPIGLIIGALSMTGMAGTLTNDLVFLAGGSVIFLLIMGAITSFILGMGMTVTAAYIFLAIILAPALIKSGLDPLSVHMFMLYWGMLSFITPPVAIGAFAAASIAKAPPMQTGFEAMRLGSIIYFIPFFFVYNPALLLQGPIGEILIVTSTALVGVVLIAGSLQGSLFGIGHLGRGTLVITGRVLVFFGGLASMAPGGTLDMTHVDLLLIASALVAPGILLTILGRRLQPQPG